MGVSVSTYIGVGGEVCIVYVLCAWCVHSYLCVSLVHNNMCPRVTLHTLGIRMLP